VKRDLFSVKSLCRLFYPEEKRMKHFGKEQQRGKTKKGGKGERERERERERRRRERMHAWRSRRVCSRDVVLCSRIHTFRVLALLPNLVAKVFQRRDASDFEIEQGRLDAL
jgi:hypothetical protein